MAHLDLQMASLIDPRSNLVTSVQGAAEKEEESSENDTEDLQLKSTKITTAIPYMSRPMAVTYLLLNIIVPGTGTTLAGFTLLCCSAPGTLTGGKSSDERLALFCLNVWVGVSQIFTVPFLLVGWLWSVVWGVMMIDLSYEQTDAGVMWGVTMETQTEAVFHLSAISDSAK